MKNYYEILGISENASNSEVERKYAELTAKYHPENFAGEAKKIVEERLKDVKEAYSVLSDDFLRDQYDKEIGVEQVERIQREKNPKPKKEKQTSEGFISRRREKRKNRPKIGTAEGLKDVTQEVFKNIPKIKWKKPDKKAVLCMLAAIGIVVIIGLILWFIPFTNGFMRSFLLIG